MLALDTLSMPLARWVLETTLVASALALVALVVARVRGSSPAVRHLFWLVVLIKLMTPPLVHWPWSRPLGPDGDRVANPTRHASTIPATLEPSDDRSPVDDEPVGRFTARPEGPGGPEVTWPSPEAWLAWAWLAGSVVLGADQIGRIARFRRTLLGATAAPPWLIAEAEGIGRRLSVRVPTIKVVDRPGTPLLWCLGRPVLLVPAELLESLEPERWRGVLAHELAHLRRGDPWVARLELVALIAWWWNPLYWLARSRIDHEAELACDAWVLWALPEGRIEYAESLLRIATSPCPDRPSAPALGVAGAGRTLERRLIMILRERVPHEISPSGLLAAAFLAATAIPSWTLGAPTPLPADPAAATAARVATVPIVPDVTDVDDDDDDERPAKKEAKPKPEAKGKLSGDAKTGPELEKELEKLGEKIGKEMEEKFGPGSDFEKKMEALGKEMEEKFGPGSDFAKEMKALGERMAEEFGPEFDLKRKGLAKAKEKAVASKGKAEAAKAKAEAAAKAKADATRSGAARPSEPAKARTDAEKRARRIEALESRIEALTKELKQLKAGDDGDEDEG